MCIELQFFISWSHVEVLPGLGKGLTSEAKRAPDGGSSDGSAGASAINYAWFAKRSGRGANPRPMRGRPGDLPM